MKHFIVHITTEYCGMEWGQTWLVNGRTPTSAQRKVERVDWTHGDGIETQRVGTVEEVSKEHYQVLSQYIPVYG